VAFGYSIGEKRSNPGQEDDGGDGGGGKLKWFAGLRPGAWRVIGIWGVALITLGIAVVLLVRRGRATRDETQDEKVSFPFQSLSTK
jgi:hypothetical protein